MLRTDGPQSSNFQRLKIKLKNYVLLFAIGAIFKIQVPQSNCEMCSAMPGAGRLPTLQVQKVQKVQKVQNFCS